MTMIKYSVNPEERPKVSFKLILKPLINVPFLAHRSWWTQTYNFINTCWGGGGKNSLKKMCLPSKVGHLKRESFFFQIMSETLPMTYEFLMKL